MRDSLSIKEYLRAHGVDNAIDLNLEELEQKYEETIREGISYYHKLLNNDNPELESPLDDENKKGVIEILKELQTTDEVYVALHDFLHTYQPTDLLAFMAELKMPVPYGSLQRIISIVHSRVQDEMLDSIKSDLELIPVQERETLVSHYESMRANVVKLAMIHNKLKGSGTLNYMRATAETKLSIIESFLQKDMEREYKPFYDNSKEKIKLISNILNISGIYTKEELFNMTIAELGQNYDEIMQQNLQKEREDKMIRRYIDIFEDSAGISDADFKNHCNEMEVALNENAVSEVIDHFSTKNHFIANKIRNAIYNPNMKPARYIETKDTLD